MLKIIIIYNRGCDVSKEIIDELIAKEVRFNCAIIHAAVRLVFIKSYLIFLKIAH